MTLSEQEQTIVDKALSWAKSNRTRLSKEIASLQKYPREEAPVSVFMSGSPGAGKTEASKELIQEIGGENSVLRLDPDEMRNFFDDYDGCNSYLFQPAVSLLVERTLDYAFKKQQSFLLDGTLSSFNVAAKNIERSLRKERAVLIIFVYQKPELAWEFVQAREAVEGRRIQPQDFVYQFFMSQKVVERIKAKFGKAVQIDLLLKDNDGKTRVNHNNIATLTPYLKPAYSIEEVCQIVGVSVESLPDLEV